LTTANVVDVSEWQPTSIDWANLKANGVKAVVVRIGHGVTRDEHAADHIANATKAGLIVHVYHYYEGVDGELQYSVNNAKSLNIQPNVYYFLDMEGTIAGSWPSIFESFRKRWAGYGWNTGLYCSLSNYAKFDNATLVKQGVYRWIAAWGSSQPSNADMWQYDSKTGLGSYASALDKDVDIAGKLIKTPDSTVVEPTDPNGNYTIKPGAFVGFDHSTTELQGGEMLVASPDGKNKIPKLAPTGAFLFNNADGDNMWTLIKPKMGTIKGEKGDAGPAPTLKIGTVTKLKPDQTPTANLSGGNGSYTLNMGIPQGVQGETNATATNALNVANGVNAKVDGLKTSGRNYIKNSESITMTPNGTDNYDLVWPVYNNVFSANAYCHGNNKTRFSFFLKPSKALSTARTFPIYWRASPYVSFGTITVPANTTDTQYYELAITTPTNQPIASQIFIRFMRQDTSDISYTIDKSMLTIGDSFPDWQPAPEDTQSQIDANKTSAANAQNTANSALSKANSNAAVLNNKVNKSDLTWANISGKPSIPNADDTTTVSSGDLNNYTTTGKYYMPNSLANYTNHPTTGTDMGDWFVMKVDVYKGAPMIVQTIYQVNSGDVWVRTKFGSNAWKSWRQVTFWPHS
jgi:hypothetical protein